MKRNVFDGNRSDAGEYLKLEVVVLNAQELNNRGVALCADGEFERGIALLRRAQSTEPEDPDLCCSLGNALAEQGRYDEALRFLRQAAELAPQHAAAKMLIAQVESEIKERNRPPHVPYKPPMVAPQPARRSVHVLHPYPSPPPAPARDVAPPRKVPWLTALVFLFLIANCGYALWLVVHPAMLPSGTESPIAYQYTYDEVVDDTPDSRSALVDNPGNKPDNRLIPGAPGPTFHIFKTNCVTESQEKVGVIKVNGDVRAFTLKNGAAQFLPPLPGDTISCAESINDAGLVVGYSGSPARHAVYWNGGKVNNLNAQIPPGSFLNLTDAICVDDAGIIVATATNDHGEPKLVHLLPR